MKVTLTSTSKVVDVTVPSDSVTGGASATFQARVWEGTTESGIPVVCLMPRIATPANEKQDEFQRELKEVAEPTALSDAFSLRMVL